MSRILFENLHIGESSNDHSLVINGTGTQQCTVRDSLIAGGFFADAVADSQIVENNVFAGRSSLGVLINMPGAGLLKFIGNTSTGVGGVILQGMSLPVVSHNYLEELVGFPTVNAAAIGGGRNALLALIGMISTAQVVHNLFNMGQALTGSNPLYIAATAVNTFVNGNLFSNSANSNTGSIWNLSTTLKTGVNTFLDSVHLGASGGTDLGSEGPWSQTTPTPVPVGGAFTTVSSEVRVKKDGTKCTVSAKVTVTNVGTATSGWSVTLPIAVVGLMPMASIDNNTGVSFPAYASGTTLTFMPTVSPANHVYYAGGTYECAA
jgi:hypothetical protein